MIVAVKQPESSASVPILLIDDDVEDVQFIKRAFKKNSIANPLFSVLSGEEALEYLLRHQKDADLLPGLILMDLNMPGIGGLETLRQIKSNERWRRIPVVVFTTSKAQEDVVSSYHLGANCFVSKPFGHDGLVKVVSEIFKFWFSVAALPEEVQE